MRSWNQKQPEKRLAALSTWCRGLDLNQQALRHVVLSHACLPISPPRRGDSWTRVSRRETSYKNIVATLLIFVDLRFESNRSSNKKEPFRDLFVACPPGRTRTYNLLVKSQLLYQLSYKGMRAEYSTRMYQYILCAGGGDRTRKVSRPRDFKSRVYTSSTTPAKAV